MRICILTHTFPRFEKDYSAPFMDGVARGIASAGNDVFVLTPFTPGFNRFEKEYKIITYKYMPFSSWHKIGYSKTLTNDMGVPLIMYILSPFMYFFGILALLRLVSKEQIEIINAHWILPNGFIAAVVSKLTNVPVVSTLPGSDVYMVKKNFIFGLMGRFSANTSKAITSNSPQLLDDLKSIGIKNNNFKKIIYGVDQDKFRPDNSESKNIRHKLKIKDDSLVILGVGRLVAKKGFEYLIKSSKNVIKKYPKTIFVIVGEGDQRNELESLIKELDLVSNFRLPGWVDYSSLKNYYNFCDIFVLPSVRDAQGNLDDQSVAVVEAMSCGKPIVTTDFPGYRLVVEDKVNGYLVPEKDSLSLEAALVKLLSDKIKLKTMSKNSRNRELDYFTWSKIGQEYTGLFKSLT
jgi:glycosyltransferase involved in cell wall biosynthesis